ncbi:hypothetical protein DKX38_027897 [Salix brachista]|uniref:Uncharacterized protein n=1 Tax=Salix brachista TaxID=2182728 RepID=A0A5N5J4A9_9ROSI|nr:hypothetical protein DKX38_027897 [Salix brachista]
MLRLWKWYQNCLTVHPVKTQMSSSGVIWGLGDIAAQSITHYTAERNRQIKEMDMDAGFDSQTFSVDYPTPLTSFFDGVPW